ncbi:MAG: MFS transporter [Nitrospiraceae bacterium]|nr:MFS transporter [Nitrospiraceae bacterium]
MEDKKPEKRKAAKGSAYRLIVLMGMVSLFGDVTYEGARSITGPYLAVLGGGAAIVGLVSGLGDFLGYALRLASGYIADRTKAYWPLTFTGYALIFAIPAMAFAGNWKIAALLIVLERLGKAIRTPARDTILSHAAKEVGRGWGFGLHELFDQIGAVLGPLIFTTVFIFRGNYRQGFGILWIPAALAMLFLARAAIKMPSPEKLEIQKAGTGERADILKEEELKKLPRLFWFYAIFTFFSVAGIMHFQLIAFHLKVQRLAPDVLIPVLYIIEMAVDGGAALVMGKAYDTGGMRFLVIAPLLSLPVAWLSLSGGFGLAVAGIAFLGVVIGIHETIMRAAIADLTVTAKRGVAYGIFNTVYGLAYLVGGVTMGLLYEKVSIAGVVAFSAVMEALAISVFVLTGFSRLKAAR